MTLSAASHWRQAFHLCPPRGLMNDPNGLVWFQGAYHVFYQWHPDACQHGLKQWGHYRSTDLVHWTSLPVALAPEHDYESHGCYSGSALVDQGGLVLLYTGNVRKGELRESYQCLARSSDALTFDKLGPVIPAPPPGFTQHFRDPKIWKDGDTYWLVIGAQTEAGQGTVLLYRGRSPESWQWTGELLPERCHGYMCECPDLFRLDDTDILLFCPQGLPAQGQRFNNRHAAGYVAGRLNAEQGAMQHGEIIELDRGFDFYAPQTLQDPQGRRLMLGWMGLPDEDQTPTVADGWTHCLTLPRALHWEGGLLRQTPPVEMQQLRGPHTRLPARFFNGTLELSQIGGDCFELVCEVQPGLSRCWGLDVRVDADHFTRLLWQADGNSLSLDRQASGEGDGGVRHTRLAAGASVRLHVFVDRSSIEVFVNRGEQVFSARIYPPADAQAIRLFAEGEVQLTRLDFWPLHAPSVCREGVE